MSRLVCVDISLIIDEIIPVARTLFSIGNMLYVYTSYTTQFVTSNKYLNEIRDNNHMGFAS